jgi:hypothetical protein
VPGLDLRLESVPLLDWVPPLHSELGLLLLDLRLEREQVQLAEV